MELGPILKQCSQWTHTFCHGALGWRLPAAAPVDGGSGQGPIPHRSAPPLAAPDEPCEERKDCHSCLTNSECGWCAATATCETGTAKRSEQSACPPARWMHKLGNRKLQCEKANALFLGDAAAEKEEAEG